MYFPYFKHFEIDKIDFLHESLAKLDRNVTNVNNLGPPP